jgi:hypothetical protein
MPQVFGFVYNKKSRSRKKTGYDGEPQSKKDPRGHFLFRPSEPCAIGPQNDQKTPSMRKNGVESARNGPKCAKNGLKLHASFCPSPHLYWVAVPRKRLVPHVLGQGNH